jgi:hypothetical protein
LETIGDNDMKQIKTIVIRMNSAKEFDTRVNAAIEEGWTLIERKVLEPHTEDKYTMLYAELERFTEPDETEDSPLTNLIENLAAFAGAMSEKLTRKALEETTPETKHYCGNCAHRDVRPNSEPCLSCGRSGLAINWEPDES